jgi:hypothetical protein
MSFGLLKDDEGDTITFALTTTPEISAFTFVESGFLLIDLDALF